VEDEGNHHDGMLVGSLPAMAVRRDAIRYGIASILFGILSSASGFAPIEAIHDAAHNTRIRSASPVTERGFDVPADFRDRARRRHRVGILMAALQHVTLVPLILEAEKYESGAAAAHKHTQVTPRPTDIGAALANVLDGCPP